VRFLLSRERAGIDLYATPVQIDPENPALPISHPPFYATYLAKLLGTYATLGLAEDTTALNEGAIGEDAFLRQAELIRKEREACSSARSNERAAAWWPAFSTPPIGCSICSTGSPDVIEPLYCDMDRIVGKALAYAGRIRRSFVLSDHGFCAFRRGVNLNSWLLREGYLALDAGLSHRASTWKGSTGRKRAYTPSGLAVSI
jgi:hypothetical protein